MISVIVNRFLSGLLSYMSTSTAHQIENMQSRKLHGTMQMNSSMVSFGVLWLTDKHYRL